MNRRGAGLLELLLALSLSVVVALLAWSILATAAARLRDRSERIGLTHALRVAAGALRAAVEPLGADAAAPADLAVSLPEQVVLRVMRAALVACRAAPDGVVVRQGAGWWSGVRAPVAGRDTLLLGSLEAAPRWLALPLAGAGAPSPCRDGSRGVLLPAVLGAVDLGLVGVGSPVRLVEPMEIRLYRAGGAGWVGVRLPATGEVIQPLAGPVLAGPRPGGWTSGFEYLTRNGAPAGAPGEVALIRVRLVGLTEPALGVGVARGKSAQTDSVELSIRLRNLP